MIDLTILDAIRTFCEERVCSKISLQIPSKEDNQDFRTRRPNAFVGRLPLPDKKGGPPVIPDWLQGKLPALVVGVNNESANGENDAGLTIRISFFVYGPEYHAQKGGRMPNYNGYHDLLNFIFTCRDHIARLHRNDEGHSAERQTFHWGLYPAQPSPYWAGWMTFDARIFQEER